MHEQLLKQPQLLPEDIARIMQCRGEHNHLGFAYQLTFVRSLNRFPTQEPLEIEEDIVKFTAIQLNIDEGQIEQYGKRQPTVSEHQETIRDYLGLRPFSTAIDEVEAFLFKEAYRLEQTAALKMRLSEFLLTHRILEPSQDTMHRLIQTQREAARNSIYSKLARGISKAGRGRLDALLETDDATYSPIHYFKQPRVLTRFVRKYTLGFLLD